MLSNETRSELLSIVSALCICDDESDILTLTAEQQLFVNIVLQAVENHPELHDFLGGFSTGKTFALIAIKKQLKERYAPDKKAPDAASTD
jgi:hypothetical protein